MDFTKKDINDIMDRLKTEYPDAGCALIKLMSSANFCHNAKLAASTSSIF